MGGRASQLIHCGAIVLAAAVSACGMPAFAQNTASDAPVAASPGSGDRFEQLRARAGAGDKRAQFELARVLEATPASWAEVAQWYRRAASADSGRNYIYMPGFGSTPGGVLPIQSGPRTEGLPEAAFRLSRMYAEGRGVRRDPGEAQEWLCRAVRGGDAEAAAVAQSSRVDCGGE